MEVFHGTTAESTQLILENGFDLKSDDINLAIKMVNDLGYGIYTYCYDPNNLWNPRCNALRYAKTYKRLTSSQIVILKINSVPNDQMSFIDLDNPVNKNKFITMRENLLDEIEVIYRGMRDNGHKRRSNKDGILIELAIFKKKFPNVDFIVKSTYTAFDKRTISNFPNGRELVIRNTNIIDKIVIVKMEG